MATTLQSLGEATLSPFSEEVRQFHNEVRGRGPGSLAPNSLFRDAEQWAAFVAEQVAHPISVARGATEEDYLNALNAALAWQVQALGKNSGPTTDPKSDEVFFAAFDASIAARKRKKWLVFGGVGAALAVVGAGAWAFLRGRKTRAA